MSELFGSLRGTLYTWGGNAEKTLTIAEQRQLVNSMEGSILLLFNSFIIGLKKTCYCLGEWIIWS